ncbi:MAG: NAD-dependent epimerase/dehydratase family protein [Candidatus Heimdallarchaeota archaeon]
MTLLITGATGLVGQALVRHLLTQTPYAREPQKIRLLVRKRKRNPYREQFLSWCSQRGVEIFYGDLKKTMSIIGFTSVTDPEDSVLIHSGAIFNLWEPYEELYTVNVQGTQKILQAFEYHGLRKMIYVSSVAVYGSYDGQNGKAVTEEFPVTPSETLGYERTKAFGESLVKDYLQDHPDRLITILRPAGIIGGPGYTLDMFSRMLSTPYTPLPRGGLDKISLVDVNDVARAIMFFTDYARGNGEAYNLVGTVTSIRDFVTSLGQALQKDDVRVFSIPLTLFRAGNLVAKVVRKFKRPQERSILIPELFQNLGKDILIDGEKITKLGFQYQVPMTESLARYGRFVMENPWYIEKKMGLAL